MPDSVKSVSQPNMDWIGSPYFGFTISRRSELLHVGSSFSDVLGYRPEDVVGKRLTEFLDRGSPLNKATIQAWGNDGRVSEDIYLLVMCSVHDEFKVIKMQISESRKRESSNDVLYVIAQDVTDVYFAENKMHSRLVDLERVHSKLSNRERIVLDLIVGGRLNKSIARELSVTERTIENIRSRLMAKFRANTTAEVVSKAAEYVTLNEILHFALSGKVRHRLLESTGELTSEY